MSEGTAHIGAEPAAGASGYLHRAYAEALAGYGRPRELPRSRGWILQRRIAAWAESDAMWCYPLFCCRDWSGLRRRP